MAEIQTIQAKKRERVGKGASRAIRRADMIPAVIYGDNKAPTPISVSTKELNRRIYAGRFLSTVLQIELDGSKHRVIPKDYQLDRVTDRPLHVDFLRVTAKSKIEVEVAVHFINHELAPGLKKGGVLNVVRHAVELICPADSIPEELVADLSGFEIGESLHISDIKLPSGVELVITNRDFTIATIAAPSEEVEETEEAEEEVVEEEAKED